MQNSEQQSKIFGTHLADCPGAAISLPWDFLQKVSSDFLQVPWGRGSVEQEHDEVTM